MNYNIVSVRNRWAQSGLLDNFDSVRQQVRLARYLESAMEILLQLDAEDELGDNTGDFIITAIVELYEMITIRRFHPAESNTRILANNLKMDEHKIDIDGLIEIGSPIVDSMYINKSDFFKQANLDMLIRDKIVQNYLIEYGTRE